VHCPKCLGNTLMISPRGVVNITINGMQRDTGRFLFNLDKESKSEIFSNFTDKLEDFFKWYSAFENKEAISVVHVYSGDFKCTITALQTCSISTQ
jgi:hypothetical protein